MSTTGKKAVLDGDAKALLDGMKERSYAWHLADDCTVLDDRCCVRSWQTVRAFYPELAHDMELVYGKDFWTAMPSTHRMLLALFVLKGEHDPAQLERALLRGFLNLENALEEEKLQAIKRGRRTASLKP